MLIIGHGTLSGDHGTDSDDHEMGISDCGTLSGDHGLVTGDSGTSGDGGRMLVLRGGGEMLRHATKEPSSFGQFWGEGEPVRRGHFVEVAERLLLVLLFIVGDPALHVI